MVAGAPGVQAQERRLRRDLGFWGLTGIGFSNIVGSGWLFAAMYAAQVAGPASLLSWVGAGLLCGLVALVMIELGASRPEGGGTVRWPLYASGRLVGTLIGWSVLLSVGGTAAEISAIMQYAAHYLPGIYNGHTLTFAGLALAVGLSVLLTAGNWFAVRLFARLNNLVSVFKIAVPVVTVIALIASGWHSGRLTDHGGFAPYGYVACLTALAGGGIVYSVNGFQAPLDFSGETRNPRRTLPAAVLTGIGLAVLMYLVLQVAFLFTVPEHLLGHGWQGVSFDSPFGQLALILNLHWLSSLLYADAVVSPGGSAYVGVALDARHTYALAKNGTIPRYFMKVDRRFGVPRRALAVNLAVIVVFLLPFGGWQDIVSVMGDMYLLIYAASAVAVAVFRAEPGGRTAGWVPGLQWIAPLSFVVASEFVYWSGWQDLRLALPLVLGGLLIFLAMRRPGAEAAGGAGAGRGAGTGAGSGGSDGTAGSDDTGDSEGAAGSGGIGPRHRSLAAELRTGAWLVTYLVALTVLSGLGTFEGTGLLPAPYDSIAVAVVATAVFFWAVRSGVRHLSATRPAAG
ncbi:amino acid transporter [Streptomyces sp. Ru73]|uniref:APC family permease n=1 Tax=Streptomyces sp. Ru73 TaxID=2080748 RepID=UPI000CDCFA5A|nr:APC family permease [Streptomyces sp. Ru73]POX36911.1 amino acid transporter [Streptomyces sp. Ru73]